MKNVLIEYQKIMIVASLYDEIIGCGGEIIQEINKKMMDML